MDSLPIGPLISAIPVVVVPLVMWVLNRTGLAADARQIEYYLKRLDLAMKLREYRQKFEEETSTGRKWSIVDLEVSQVLAFVQTLQSHQTEIAAEELREVRQPTEMSLFRRLFLLFKPITGGGWIFLALFYYTIIGMVTYPFIISAPVGVGMQFSMEMVVVMIVIYGGLAAMFRYFALRSYKRRLDIGALESKSEI